MALVKCLAIILLCSYTCSGALAPTERSIPDTLLYDLSFNGKSTLTQAVNAQTRDLNSALDAHDIVDARCDSKRQAANRTCTSCVENKCETKRRSCPTLANIVKFIIPNFFENTVPNSAAVAGRRIAGIGASAGNAIKAIGEDTIGRLRDEAVKAGKIFVGVGEEFKKAAEKAKDFAESAGKAIISFGEDAINALKDAANTVKNFLLGKRKRSLKLIKRSASLGSNSNLPTSPPSCSDLLANPSNCGYYTRECSTCSFNAETECPGWKASNDRVKTETADAKWIEDNEQNNEYGLEEIIYDRRNYDFDTGGFTNAKVISNLFGNRYSFVVAEPLDLILADQTTAGAIVRYAIAAAKLNKARSG